MDRYTYLREVWGYFHWLRVRTDDCKGEVLRLRKWVEKMRHPQTKWTDDQKDYFLWRLDKLEHDIEVIQGYCGDLRDRVEKEVT